MSEMTTEQSMVERAVPFKKGERVVRKPGRQGTIISVEGSSFVRVLWDGCKHPVTFHISFIDAALKP